MVCVREREIERDRSREWERERESALMEEDARILLLAF